MEIEFSMQSIGHTGRHQVGKWWSVLVELDHIIEASSSCHLASLEKFGRHFSLVIFQANLSTALLISTNPNIVFKMSSTGKFIRASTIYALYGHSDWKQFFSSGGLGCIYSQDFPNPCCCPFLTTVGCNVLDQ